MEYAIMTFEDIEEMERSGLNVYAWNLYKQNEELIRKVNYLETLQTHQNNTFTNQSMWISKLIDIVGKLSD